MALPVVLLLLAFLTALTLQWQIFMRTRLAAEERASAKAALRTAATEAAWRAVTSLAAQTPPTLANTNDAWARPTRLERPDGMVVTAQIRDAGRRFNANNLRRNSTAMLLPRPPLLIMHELLQAMAHPAPVTAIQRLQDYFHQYPETGAPAAADLCALLPEIPPQTLNEHLVILPAQAGFVPINVNAATPAVLQTVIGAARAWAAAMLTQERNRQPLTALEQSAVYKELRECAAYLDVQSRFFEIEAEAQSAGQRLQVWALTEYATDGQWHIRRWVSP